MKTNYINRRDLLLLGAASALPAFPTISQAIIPSVPPASLSYLWFIANGIYKISPLPIIDLPPEAGTCRDYRETIVGHAVHQNFNFTGKSGINPWNMLVGALQFEYWEVLDLRTGRYVNLYVGDRIEVRFADGSRVKVVFRGPSAFIRFEPLRGTERLPNGTRLYGGTGGTGEHAGKEKGRKGSGVMSVTPSVANFSWSWSTQETPW